jgi:hypothetical protein
VGWDPSKEDVGQIAEQTRVFDEAGIGSLHIAPDRGDLDSWLPPRRPGPCFEPQSEVKGKPSSHISTPTSGCSWSCRH